MEYRALLKVNFRRHKGSFWGIVMLIFIIIASLCSILSMWQNSNTYIVNEIERLGFGDITAWVTNKSDINQLVSQMTAQEQVQKVGIQSLIYSNYSIKGLESDSEGQLIVHNKEAYQYKILTDDLTGYKEDIISIAEGEVYISPSLKSTFDIEIGDTIQFPIARNGVEKSFTVKGYFEDPFMGSSMIGMKGFLISNEDYLEIVQMCNESGIDALAREGAMLHIFKANDSDLSNAEFNSLLNAKTNIQNYLEFTHSKEAIIGFMLMLQNVFTGFLSVFTVVLIMICLVVIGHSISSTITQDYINIGILKAMGMTSGVLKRSQVMFYVIAIVLGVLLGIVVAIPLTEQLIKMTITTTGVLIPTSLNTKLSSLVICVIVILIIGFILVRVNGISKISPLSAICREMEQSYLHHIGNTPISKKGLNFWIAIRQLTTRKRQYISIFTITILLVFFACLVGRMNVWLGPNGEGMMNAFNPADHDIGIEIVGNTSFEQIESTIAAYTGIKDSYVLAMPSVAVNGIDYTANVISEPERFHILEGRASFAEDEIVITEFVAQDLNLKIGDSVSVASGTSAQNYTITGIYQCANDMGNNIGMSREGYLRIASEKSNMWCGHYFLEDTSQQPNVIEALNKEHGRNIHLHENTWPGLYSIITAMQWLTIFMYVIVIIFIFVVVMLTGSKILYREQKDLGIYKSLGFLARDLQLSFACRFGVVSGIGAVVGVILSHALGDHMIAAMLRLYGISNFTSNLGIQSALLPVCIVVSSYFVFAYIAAAKIKKVDLKTLVVE